MVMRNLSRYLPLLPLLVTLVLITGCKEKNTSGDAAQAKPAPEVSVVTIQEQAVTLTTILPGRITPHLEAEIRPQVSGIILKRLFTEGGEVKEGEVLYQIDPATYRASLASAKASLAKAEANSVNLKQHAERYRRLVPTKAVSSQDYEDAVAAYDQGVAEIRAAKAAVDMAQINLNYTRVTAPISGHIGRSAVTAGALVTANQGTALANIQQLDPVYVDVTQASADLLQLKQNLAAGTLKSNPAQATVKLELENGTSYTHDGILKFSEVSVDQSTVRSPFGPCSPTRINCSSPACSSAPSSRKACGKTPCSFRNGASAAILPAMRLPWWLVPATRLSVASSRPNARWAMLGWSPTVLSPATG